MKFILGDYFTHRFDEKFDGIITDIPWEALKSIPKFKYKEFMAKTRVETKDDSFLVTFCNMLAMHDLINNSGGGMVF